MYKYYMVLFSYCMCKINTCTCTCKSVHDGASNTLVCTHVSNIHVTKEKMGTITDFL